MGETFILGITGEVITSTKLLELALGFVNHFFKKICSRYKLFLNLYRGKYIPHQACHNLAVEIIPVVILPLF